MYMYTSLSLYVYIYIYIEREILGLNIFFRARQELAELRAAMSVEARLRLGCSGMWCFRMGVFRILV